jgi:hypothetical protein
MNEMAWVIRTSFLEMMAILHSVWRTVIHVIGGFHDLFPISPGVTKQEYGKITAYQESV